MKTFASLFSGCEGAGVGARAAGLKPIWGVEIDPKAAAIAALNGFNTTIADVRTVDWMQFDSPFWLHASPSCCNASVANPKAGEKEEDIELAAAVCAAIAHHRPTFFSLENVEAYRRFNSYSLIISKLSAMGYTWMPMLLNAANYGVPQTRQRFFLVASRVGYPKIPMSTHQEIAGQYDLWSPTPIAAWVGWKEALQGLPDPKKVELSDRMKAMVPSEFVGRAFMSGWKDCSASRPLTVRRFDEPAPTIIAAMCQPTTRPHIVERSPNGIVTASVLGSQHMAALQNFPVDYRWGDDGPAAFRAIGNAVPPLLMQRIVEANVPCDRLGARIQAIAHE